MKSDFREGFNFLDIPHGTENVFNLDDPSSYYCRVFRYHISHSGLCIQLIREGHDNLYLDFAGVQYFEFPQFWKGANFALSGDTVEKERCILKNPHIVKSDDISYWVASHHLLICHTDEGVVKLLFGYRHVLLTNRMSL